MHTKTVAVPKTNNIYHHTLEYLPTYIKRLKYIHNVGSEYSDGFRVRNSVVKRAYPNRYCTQKSLSNIGVHLTPLKSTVRIHSLWIGRVSVLCTLTSEEGER
jgi:hypothetical protein